MIMSQPNLQSFRGLYRSWLDSIRTACLKCVPPCLRRHHQVHPVFLHDDNCEFLQLHPQRRIRVIHFNTTDQEQVDGLENCNKKHDPHEDVSATDDYWFVRCSHSSFRLLRKKEQPSELANRTVRYSFQNKEKLKPCIEEQPNQSVDVIVDCLVRKLIREAITDAVQLLHKSQRRDIPQASSKQQNGTVNTSGCVNQGFVVEESAIKPESQEKKEGSKQKSKRSSSKQFSKPLLLFLHGAGSSAEVWSPLLAYFASAGYEVIAPDLLGHGFSSAPSQQSAYTFACLLQDALQIFDTFVTEPRKCVVIGHSYGCSFAAAVARYRPQSVVQLVLISGGGPTPLAPNGGIYTLPRCLLGCAKPLLLCGFRRELFYAARGKQLVFIEGGVSEVPAYIMDNIRLGQVWPQGDTAFHRRIQVPTLLIHGMSDPHITLVEECEMERTIPRSFLEIIPGAGHWSMLEAPAQLCHMLHCFITLWDKAGALSK